MQKKTKIFSEAAILVEPTVLLHIEKVTLHLTTVKETADWLEQRLGRNSSLCTPLGLGKPNQLLNEVYRRFKSDPSRSLTLFTALSLLVPSGKSELEKRFLGDFRDRHFGKDYPELEYAKDAAQDQLPKNITLHEFYFQAGSLVGQSAAQANYISLNYTHVAQSVYEQEVQALLCLIAPHPRGENKYSLSCNPDLTLDVADVYRKNGKRMIMVGVIHPDLPYMAGESEVNEDFFDVILKSKEITHELFALPREPIQNADYLIGFQASLLLHDGGTIQIGIGSLAEALVYSSILRQEKPALYQKLAKQWLKDHLPPSQNRSAFQITPFTEGLYGTSEMVMDVFMHLRRAGILKRDIRDADENIRRYLHGAFFLGSKEFYQWMRERFQEGDTGLDMTRVSKVNDLYDAHELAIRRQRVKARFFNMSMNVSLLGTTASDTLRNGQVVSGVGGQYNFVSMAHELPDSHSVILMRSHRNVRGRDVSNIVWGHEFATLPRHLRDVFITEYGVAFTRGRSDEAVIRSIIEISDSRFQNSLIKIAQKNKKLSPHYEVPSHARDHHSSGVDEWLAPLQAEGLFPAFPFGSDFTPIEQKILFSLLKIKHALSHPSQLVKLLLSGMKASAPRFASELERMKLAKPSHFKEWLYQKLLLGALTANDRL